MSLSAEQVALIQTSFTQVVIDSDAVARLFYARLFSLDPSLKPMFKGDMREQGRKLMQMLAVAVSMLDKLDKLVPAVQALGKRHVGYGVKKEHYDTVGAALIWTLEQGLGPAFTPEVREAWVALYGVLVSVATQGLYEETDEAVA